MKKLYHESKKQVIEKLKYLSSIMDVLANIVKSFATIMGSLVAGVATGVTGYYEIKKTVKQERAKKNVALAPKPLEGAATATGGGSGVSLGETASTSVPTAPEQPSGYYVDMNTGAFVLSLVMLGVLMFKKFKKQETKP